MLVSDGGEDGGDQQATKVLQLFERVLGEALKVKNMVFAVYRVGHPKDMLDKTLV